MTSSWTHVVRAVAVVALAAGGMAGMGSTAQAAPTGCDAHALSNGYYVYCAGGSGQYRAAVTCWYNHGTQSRSRYGVWRNAGGLPSQVSCLSSEELGGYRTEKKG
ncbi:hypothetical protein [Streptomyces sp. NPDC004065]|uniref:hypothetical protein n=1 Tax=Streptomyces sp. NPDC004065 TaxID=3364689 RepID=UPI00384F11BF